jgi:demethylmenaquinone methyltransferase / 2-methoxy-6-polyprenyl-1,4-benzoquinol methylase
MTVTSNARDYAVQRMFDRIAGRYDLLNRVISFRLDARWRNQAIHTILAAGDPLILDLGAGTGDLTFNAARAIGGAGRIVGLDFSLQMLRLAQEKRTSALHGERTSFVLGSALVSPFKDGVFDGVMTAFVLRNVSDLNVFFAHAFRVLKPGGKLVSLDMFPPSKNWFSPFYALYFYRLVPWIGGLLAHDRTAYRYLSESVRHFHPPETVAYLLEQAGFRRVTVRKFLNGAVCMHVAEKANASTLTV